MLRNGWRAGGIGIERTPDQRAGAALLWLACGLLVGSGTARGQGVTLPSAQAGTGMAIESLDQLTCLSAAQLEQLYRQAGACTVPPGRVQGRALYPDVPLGRFRSRMARAVWQGKVFHPEDSTAINRFFGLRMIRGQVYSGTSWLDGQPALILDYSQTSLVYRPYRDEIREIAPGIYLGLMYARREPNPTFKMFFALDARSGG